MTAADLRRAIVVGALLAVSAVVLPILDTLHEAEWARAAAGSGLGAAPGPNTAMIVGMYLVAAAAIMLAVVKTFARPERSIVLVIATAMVVGLLAFQSSAEIACKRSGAIDMWTLCEKPGMSASGYPVYVSRSAWRTNHFAGPALDNGDPCVNESEHREQHRVDHPDGDLIDGVHQILYRFPADRARVVYVPLALLSCLMLAIVLAVRNARRQRTTG